MLAKFWAFLKGKGFTLWVIFLVCLGALLMVFGLPGGLALVRKMRKLLGDEEESDSARALQAMKKSLVQKSLEHARARAELEQRELDLEQTQREIVEKVQTMPLEGLAAEFNRIRREREEMEKQRAKHP